jgi:3-deoxy-D-manno-octulosonic-acid transferase
MPNLLDPIYLLVAGVTAPWWARKARGGWSERFGQIDPVVRASGRGRIMLHAVSVGEVSALRHLVPLLTPHCNVLVTASTDTGLKRAQELYGQTCDVRRYPLDASWAVRRFLDAARPDVVALVELELWPNFIRACADRGIPVGVINGRLSERSFKGYSRLRWYLRRVFGALEFAAVQDADYASRFEAMGVPPGRCLLTGSMKWDSARIEDDVAGASALAAEMGIDAARPLIVAGSTGPGEEALLHEACPKGVQLLCAPRRPERFDEAAASMPGCVRRSRKQARPGADRFLLDTIGELRQAYALATVVVVGRSFGDLHGSDPIEPVALGRATVIGPAVSDFARVVAALEEGGGLVRADRGTLPRVLSRLVDDPTERRTLAERGRAAIRVQQGASDRHAELLLSLVDARKRAETAVQGPANTIARG